MDYGEIIEGMGIDMKSKRIVLGAFGLACISVLGIISYNNSSYKNNVAQKEKSIPREKKAHTILCVSWAWGYGDGSGSIDDMAENSDLIALITVDGVERVYAQEGLPFTEFNVCVDIPIYNVKKGEKFGIIMTGQETETTLVELSSDPLMVEGEKALVFCKKNTDGTYRILGGPQGRFVYQDGKLTSLELQLLKTRGGTTSTDGMIEDAEVDDVVGQIEGCLRKFGK